MDQKGEAIMTLLSLHEMNKSTPLHLLLLQHDILKSIGIAKRKLKII